MFFVSEVHENESWIIYDASLFYRTWKSYLIPKLEVCPYTELAKISEKIRFFESFPHI